MILQVLVRNYYEMYGTFRGIENSAIGDLIDDAMYHSGMSLADFCSAMLGYKGLHPAAVQELRKKALIGQSLDLVEVTEALGEVVTTENVLKKLGVGKRYNSLTVVKSLSKKGLDNVYRLVGEYYLNDLSNCIPIGDKILPFKYWLLGNRKKSVSTILSSQVTVQGLINYVVDKNCVQPLVTCQTLVIDKELTKTEWDSIQKAAIGYATCKDSPVSNLLKLSQHDLANVSFTSPRTYLEILDFASSINSTYQSEVARIGISIPNIILAWTKTGYAFQCFDDTTVSIAVDDNRVWSTNTVEEFMTLCKSELEPIPPKTDFGGDLCELHCI